MFSLFSRVSAIAMASMIFAEPFWNVINSDEHYLDLYKYIMPLRDRLEHGQGKSIYLKSLSLQIFSWDFRSGSGATPYVPDSR
jgi:hypothetical protein